MLYDKRWDKQAETKVDPFSLAGLIAWLEKQPADKEYIWLWCDRCLFGQYLIAHGFNPIDNYVDLRKAIFDGIRNRTKILIALDRPHTFGAALERARKVAASKD